MLFCFVKRLRAKRNTYSKFLGYWVSGPDKLKSLRPSSFGLIDNQNLSSFTDTRLRRGNRNFVVHVGLIMLER